MEIFSGMAIRYGDSIIKKALYFIMLLFYYVILKLGQAIRVPVE